MLLWGCVLDLVVRSRMRVDVRVDYFVFICDFGLDALLVLVLAGLVWLVGSCAFWVCLNTICCCLADCGFELGVVIAVSLVVVVCCLVLSYLLFVVSGVYC